MVHVFHVFCDFFWDFCMISLRLTFLKANEGLFRDEIACYDHFMSYIFFENLQAIFTCCNLSSMVAFSLDFLHKGFKRSYVCMTILWAICRGTTNTNKQNDTNFCNFFQVFWKFCGLFFCRRFLRAAIRVLWLLFLLIFLIMVSKGHTCVWPFYELCRGTTNTDKQNDTNFCIFFQVFWKFCRRFFRAAIWVLWLLFLLIFLIMVSKGHTCVWPFYELCRGTTNTNKQNDTNFCNFFRFFENFADDFFALGFYVLQFEFYGCFFSWFS